MPDFKTPAIRRTRLFRELIEASKAGPSVRYVYFDEKEELRAKFKIVDDKLKIIFEQDDVAEFKNINIEQINTSLKDDRERTDFKSSYEKVKSYLASGHLENGINPNRACTAFWGPKNNKERTSQRYNAYEHFFFKVSDLRRLGNHFEKLLKRISRNYIKINELADFFADNSQDILPTKHESQDDKQTNKKHYLPTKNDCEKAVEALIESGRDGFGKEEVIVWLASYFNKNSILLKDKWRIVTQRNIEIWFQWKMESGDKVGYTYEGGRFYSKPYS